MKGGPISMKQPKKPISGLQRNETLNQTNEKDWCAIGMQNSVFFGTTKQSIKPLTKEKENQIKDVNKETLTNISTQGMRRKKIYEQQHVTEHEDDNSKNTTHLSQQTHFSIFPIEN